MAKDLKSRYHIGLRNGLNHLNPIFMPFSKQSRTMSTIPTSNLTINESMAAMSKDDQEWYQNCLNTLPNSVENLDGENGTFLESSNMTSSVTNPNELPDTCLRILNFRNNPVSIFSEGEKSTIIAVYT